MRHATPTHLTCYMNIDDIQLTDNDKEDNDVDGKSL